MQLTNDQLTQYREEGWVGPFKLLATDEVDALTESYKANSHIFAAPADMHAMEDSAFNEKPWFKSAHAHIPTFYELATQPQIVEKVKSIIGDDVLLWGTCVMKKKPAQKHDWHTDIEHKKLNGVSVFIGLKSTSSKATMKVITKSHLIKNQEIVSSQKDIMILAQSRKQQPTSQLVSIDLEEGEFFLFDGSIWHGSENNSDSVRYAAIAQYTTPDCKVEIPMNWNEPVRWSEFAPPCVLVSGKDDFHLNSLV